MSVRFVHTADWQLGLHRHFLDPDAQARFSDARIEAVARIGELVAEEGCAFVVVAGDVFEDNHVARRTVWRALDAMARIPARVLLLPGNHDPLNAGSIYRSAEFDERKPANVTVLADAEPVAVAPGVEVVGAPWASKRPLEDLCGRAVARREPTAGIQRILVGHGIVDELAADRDDPAVIRVEGLARALDERRIDYVALGDRHSATPVGTTGRIWYAGAPEPTDYDEVNPGKALLVDLGDDTCTVSERQVGTWRFARERFALTDDTDLGQLEAWLGGVADHKRTIAKLGFVGSLTMRGRVALDTSLEEAGETLAALETWDRRTDLVVTCGDDDLAALDLGGFARDAAERLDARARGAGEEVASDALALLHRLARPA